MKKKAKRDVPGVNTYTILQKRKETQRQEELVASSPEKMVNTEKKRYAYMRSKPNQSCTHTDAHIQSSLKFGCRIRAKSSTMELTMTLKCVCLCMCAVYSHINVAEQTQSAFSHSIYRFFCCCCCCCYFASIDTLAYSFSLVFSQLSILFTHKTHWYAHIYMESWFFVFACAESLIVAAVVVKSYSIFYNNNGKRARKKRPEFVNVYLRQRVWTDEHKSVWKEFQST